MLDILIGMNKKKYGDLNDANFLPKNKSDGEVNLFIDLPTILSKLYVKNNISSILNYPSDQVVAITSGVINIISHYRRYMYGRGYHTNRIYLLFNRSIPEYQSKIMSYGHLHFDKYSEANIDLKVINKIIDTAIGYIRKIVDHVPGVYFPHTDGIEDYVAAYHLMDNESKNIILTKYEEYFLLLPHKDCKIMIPKKDEPKIIDRDNIIDYLTEENAYSSDYITYKMLTNLYTFVGLKNREMDSALGFKKVKTLKLFDRLLEEEIITNDISPKQLFWCISHGIDEKVVGELYARYLMIDAKQAESGISITKRQIIKNTMVDLYDERGLEEYNNHVDKDHIINIYDLMKYSTKNKWG